MSLLETKHLTPHQGEASYSAATFDPASKRLFFLSNDGREFAALRTYDLATGAMRDHEKADWDIANTYFSRDGRYRVTTVNQDGSTVIRIVEGADEKPVKLPTLPGGDIRGVTFSKSGARIAFYLNGDRSPSNLYVYDFARRNVKQLTQSLNPKNATLILSGLLKKDLQHVKNTYSKMLPKQHTWTLFQKNEWFAIEIGELATSDEIWWHAKVAVDATSDEDWWEDVLVMSNFGQTLSLIRAG